MSIRQKLDSQAFLFEEKFDTWLDLTHLRNLSNLQFGSDAFKAHVRAHYGRNTLAQLSTNQWEDVFSEPPRVNPHIIPSMMQTIFSEEVHKTSSTVLNKEEIKVPFKASTKMLEMQMKQMYDLMSTDLTSLTLEAQIEWVSRISTFPSELSVSAGLSLACNDLLLKVKQLHRYQSRRQLRDHSHLENSCKYDNQLWKFINAEWKLTQDLYACKWKSHWYLCDKQLLLLLVNKLREAEVALLYSHLTSGVGQPGNFFQLVCKAMNLFSEMCASCAHTSTKEDINKPYAFLKAVEGLGVGIMIYNEDKTHGWTNTLLLDELWKGLLEDGIVEENRWQDNPVCQLFLGAPSCSISEILGLAKVCGHPDVEIVQGLKKLYTRTHKKITVDNNEVTKSVRVLKSDLCKNFFLKHHKWPVLDLAQRIPQVLLKYILRNRDPNLPEFRDLQRDCGGDAMWDFIEIGKNQEFDRVECILPLLKDKSISPTRSVVMRHLIRRYGHYRKVVIDEEPPLESVPGTYLDIRRQKAEESRALLRYLLTDSMEQDMLDYLEDFNRVPNNPGCDSSDWDDVLDYLVIKLTPKEKELKSEGRMFGSSPLVERNRRIVQEKNIYDLMAAYMPEQLLTCSEIDTIRKLYAFRCMKQACPGHTILQISFDFSAWNNFFRPESIDNPGGQLLDKWFGTNIYGKTMKTYKQMLVYGFSEEDCYFWEGQDGGIEGLNQGTWTYCFTGAVKAALNQLNYVYKLSVKGDDCRAAIAIKDSHIREKGLDVIRDEIGQVLQEICERFGYSLKPSESFVSISLIATSKQYQINDTWLPNVIKKLMKVPSFSNLIYPTVSDKVSSMFSNAHSACSQGTDTIAIWITAVNIAGRYLKTVLPKLSWTDLVVLLSWPQILGGPGALPLQTFIVRGENDLLSVTISMFHSIISNYPNLEEAFWNILCVKDRESAESELSLLLSDCYALKRDHPRAPKSVLKSAIRAGLMKVTKNSTISALLEASESEEATIWVKFLTSMRPFYPKIATSVWECLPYYLVEELISKFDNSQTVFKLLALGSSRRSRLNVSKTMTRMIMAEEAQLSFWEKVLIGELDFAESFYGYSKKDFLALCPTEVTQAAREKSWGISPIIGITYPSILSQVWYTSAPTLASNSFMFKYEKCHFTYTIPKGNFQYELCNYKSDHYASIKDNIPWLGHTTSSRLKMPQVDLNKCSPPLQKVKRLLALSQRSKEFGPDIKRLCDQILGAYTSQDMSVYKVLEPEMSSGSVAHRLETNSFSCTTMPNYRPNLMQILFRDYDTNTLLRGQLRDMTMNFAARAYYDVWVVTSPLQFQENLPEKWPEQLWTVIHDTDFTSKTYVVCPSCLADVSDTTVKFTGTPLSVKEFRHINLVGLSVHEESFIKNAANELFELKTKDKILSKGLPLSEDLVELARFISATQLASQRSAFGAIVRGLNTIKLPTGSVGEILCQTSGVPIPSDIGMNDIRCMSPKCLVDALTRELWFFFGPEFSRHRVSTVKNLVQSLPSWRNPITGTVEMIYKSGKLSYVCAEIHKRVPGGANCMGSSVLMSVSAATSWITRVLGGEIIESLELGRRPSPVLMKIRLESNDLVLRQAERVQDIIYKLFLNRFMKSAFSHKQLWKFNKLLVLPKHWVDGFESQSDSDLEKGATLVPEPWDTAQELRSLFDSKGKLKHKDFKLCQDNCDEWMGTVISDEDKFKSVCFTLFAPFVLNSLEKTELSLESIDKAILSGDPVVLVHFTQENEPTSLMDLFDHPSWPIVSHWIPLGLYQILAGWAFEFLETTALQPFLLQILEVGFQLFESCPEEQKSLELYKMNLEDAIRIIRSNPDKTWFDVQKQYTDGLKLESSNMPFNSTCHGCKNETGSLLTCVRHMKVSTVGTLPPEIKGRYYERLEMAVSPLEEYYAVREKNQWIPAYSYLARCVGNGNTSVSKFLECLASVGIDIDLVQKEKPSDTNAFICTADGAGGVTNMFLLILPNSKGVYNSLLTADSHPHGFPPETLMSHSETELSHRLQAHLGYPGDLTSEYTQSAIIQMCLETGLFPSFMTCDAEGKNIDTNPAYVKILRGFLKIFCAVGNGRTVIILKTFVTSSRNVIDVWLALMSASEHVHVIKPASSHSRSGEFFLVCTGTDKHNLGLRLEQGATCNFSLDAFDSLLLFLNRFREQREDTMSAFGYHEYQLLCNYYLENYLHPLRISVFYNKLNIERPRPSQPQLSLTPLITEAQRRNTALWANITDGKFDRMYNKKGVLIEKSNALMNMVLRTYFTLAGFLYRDVSPHMSVEMLIMNLKGENFEEKVLDVLTAIINTRVFGCRKCPDHPNCLLLKGFYHFNYSEPYMRGVETLLQLSGWIGFIRLAAQQRPEELREELTKQGNRLLDIEGLLVEQNITEERVVDWADDDYDEFSSWCE